MERFQHVTPMKAEQKATRARNKPAKRKAESSSRRKSKKPIQPMGTGLSDLLSETGIPIPKSDQSEEKTEKKQTEENAMELEELKEKHKDLKREHQNLKKRFNRLSEKEEKLNGSLNESQVKIEHLEAWQNMARAILNNTAVLLYEAKMDQEAAIVFKKILKLDPDNELVKENLEMLEGEDSER